MTNKYDHVGRKWAEEAREKVERDRAAVKVIAQEAAEKFWNLARANDITVHAYVYFDRSEDGDGMRRTRSMTLQDFAEIINDCALDSLLDIPDADDAAREAYNDGCMGPEADDE